MGAPVLLKNAVDATVLSTVPSKNYSTVARNYMQAIGGGRECFSYLYFGVPSGMAKTTILSAKLHLINGTALTGSRSISVHRIASRWGTSTINYNNKPATTGSAITVTKTAPALYDEWIIDVTSMMQQVADGAAWYGFRLSTSSTSLVSVYSAQATSWARPYLEITWSDAPDTPEVLVPDNGELVSLDKPTLTWDFTDPSGDTTMQAYQLRLFSTEANALVAPAGTSPVLDTGVVLSDVPHCNLAETSYAGLADGGHLWWRVAVQDGAGLWSGWSDPADFIRKSKGTLTITNPAASPNNFVTEPTPPFTWTFTGRTQRAFEVLLTTPSAPAVYLWRSGIRTSTETSVTPPLGIIKENGKTYRVLVRVYDTESPRRSTPGDPTYTEVSRDFTFELQNTVSPVTGFTATVDPIYPKITLEWDRATAPDSFLLYRDNKVVQEIMPEDCLVSGTHYLWVDQSAAPRKQHNWFIAARVNGVSSSGNPSYTGIVKAVTTALSELDGSNTVFFFNPDAQADKTESSEIHYVLGSAPPVMITQSLRGYEGSISGVLVNDVIPGETASSQLAKLNDFKDNPGKVYKLTWVDKVMQVVIRGVTDSPLPHPDGTVEYLAHFEFFQVDF